MKLEILMSTMNCASIEDLQLDKKNIKDNILIINQTNNNSVYEKNNVRMYNYKEKGLSKSRNRAIENCRGDICIIADDDIVYKKNYKNIILNSFKTNPDCDVITFQIETPDGKLYKNYSKSECFHNKRSILKVSSICIAFKSKSIIEKGIRFNEKFGLGAKYVSGEENIFLKDCIDSGLKVKYIPKPIVIHPYDSSGKNLTTKQTISKGALFWELFGWKSLFINVIFAIKKRNEYKNRFSTLEVIKLLYKGFFDYISE